MASADGPFTASQASVAAPVHISYRRNGKLYSCEPCRKGKLRCDHAIPVCGRCARRGRAAQCVYHPAPLTKPRNPAEKSSSAPLLQNTSPMTSPYTIAPPPQHSRATLATPPSNLGTTVVQQASTRPVRDPLIARHSATSSPLMAAETNARGAHRAWSTVSAPVTRTDSSMLFRDSRSGFLGPTAYSAVYTENPESLTLIDADTPTEEEDTSFLPPLSQDKIQQGAEVLATLRNLPLFQHFTKRWLDISIGVVVVQPAFRIWVEELWAEFGPVLTEGNPSQLLRLSELCFRNTRRQFKPHGRMSPLEWSKAATGRHIRWEVVGIILSSVGLSAMTLNTWDSAFDDFRESIVDRATFGDQMRKVSETCLCFCYECEAINDIYLCFLYQELVLVESIKGDAHYAAWQRTGEVLDTAVAMGMHQGNNIDADTSFFVSQLRKTVFLSAFSRDKTIASFLGRPPRLSYRYCKLEMPFDLSDDELFLEGAELDAALAQLDANGWNTVGKVHRRTWFRVWFQNSIVREEILEIALGSGDEDVEAKAQQIRVKLERFHDSLPDFMKMSPTEVLDPSGAHANACYSAKLSERMNRRIDSFHMVWIGAGILLTEFLLDRALVNRNKQDIKSLIPISRKLLKLVLLAQRHRDLWSDFSGDMPYLLIVYGLPSAGVLAIELYKQEKAHQYTPDILPKSETIQELSVFISALAMCDPGAANHSICDQGRRALTRVLDHILTPCAPPTTTNPDPHDFDSTRLYFPTGNDAEFLQWLDNIEWDKGSLNHGPPTGFP